MKRKIQTIRDAWQIQQDTVSIDCRNPHGNQRRDRKAALRLPFALFLCPVHLPFFAWSQSKKSQLVTHCEILKYYKKISQRHATALCCPHTRWRQQYGAPPDVRDCSTRSNLVCSSVCDVAERERQPWHCNWHVSLFLSLSSSPTTLIKTWPCFATFIHVLVNQPSA